jgi:cytidyltransferase-like protein
MAAVFVSGAFDDLRSRDVRFLEEAAKLGPVTAGLWTDDLVRAREKRPPKFPFDERLYILQAMRHVAAVVPLGDLSPAGSSDQRPGSRPGLRSVLEDLKPRLCVTDEQGPGPGLISRCQELGIEVRSLAQDVLSGFPSLPSLAVDEGSGRQRVVVTGCYDWFHSGHVRFFEEAAAFGDLYVGVGSDANLRRLKGQGHPLFPQDERAYLVRSVRHVRQAFIATGSGWMDAAPEMAVLRPHYYVVNEDGDRPEKREFCKAARIAYVVLSRRPKPGLPARDSSALRGF